MNTDPTQAALDMATAQALMFCMAVHSMTAEQRVEFVQTYLAAVSGMAEHAIGHQATAEAFAMVAQQRPAIDVLRVLQ